MLIGPRGAESPEVAKGPPPRVLGGDSGLAASGTRWEHWDGPPAGTRRSTGTAFLLDSVEHSQTRQSWAAAYGPAGGQASGRQQWPQQEARHPVAAADVPGRRHSARGSRSGAQQDGPSALGLRMSPADTREWNEETQLDCPEARPAQCPIRGPCPVRRLLRCWQERARSPNRGTVGVYGVGKRLGGLVGGGERDRVTRGRERRKKKVAREHRQKEARGYAPRWRGGQSDTMRPHRQEYAKRESCLQSCSKCRLCGVRRWDARLRYRESSNQPPPPQRLPLLQIRKESKMGARGSLGSNGLARVRARARRKQGEALKGDR
uniref:Uncharacterized protein n=1 Tax=Knipowitschia caucasica TaxID=637954 RepID=A0AAV2LTK2_KNICA